MADSHLFSCPSLDPVNKLLAWVRFTESIRFTRSMDPMHWMDPMDRIHGSDASDASAWIRCIGSDLTEIQ